MIKKSERFFERVVIPAIESIEDPLLEPKTFTDAKHSTEIVDRVHEGINKSRILIFDLSTDPRYSNWLHKNVNANVAYELGVARDVREDRDIILVTDSKKIEKEIFFDVRPGNILNIQDIKSIGDFKEILIKVIRSQEDYQDKRIESICKSVGIEAVALIKKYGIRPSGRSHFVTDTAMEQIAALRLLDLGILYTGWDRPKGKFLPLAYDWTSLGRAVVKHFGLRAISLEEFDKSEEYSEEHKEFEAMLRSYQPYLEAVETKEKN